VGNCGMCHKSIFLDFLFLSIVLFSLYFGIYRSYFYLYLKAQREKTLHLMREALGEIFNSSNLLKFSLYSCFYHEQDGCCFAFYKFAK